MNPIISKKWLLDRMHEPNLIIVDCRFELGRPQAGREAFAASHIPGSLYLDLEQDLSAPPGPHGGRHPLPDPGELSQRLGQAGIGNSTRVVAYDDQGGMNASRLWWLLKWLGHDEVYVLDEGFAAWQASEYPVTDETRDVVPAAFIPSLRPNMLAAMEDVRQSLDRPEVLLVDSRDADRFAGLVEPIDAKAGHIPGAVNRFWRQALNNTGAWKTDAQLSVHLAPLTSAIDAGREVIVYCGSGVSACPNVLALHRLGYPQVKLYAGSWSDWISYPDNPIATGTE